MTVPGINRFPEVIRRNNFGFLSRYTWTRRPRIFLSLISSKPHNSRAAPRNIPNAPPEKRRIVSDSLFANIAALMNAAMARAIGIQELVHDLAPDRVFISARHFLRPLKRLVRLFSFVAAHGTFYKKDSLKDTASQQNLRWPQVFPSILLVDWDWLPSMHEQESRLHERYAT